MESRIKQNLLEGRNVIFDATNINYKKRRDWLNRFNKYNIKKIAVLVATPYDECLERNKKRERNVPEEVIKRMYYNFYVPQYYEGFDEITIIRNTLKTFWTTELFNILNKIEQDNPHHNLTIGEHCRKAAICINADTDSVLFKSALYHDIGKAETKTFINTKGEETEIAHFYGHEHVGAYMSLFYTDDDEKALKIAKLIQWHMLLYKELSEKTIEKYKNLLGKEEWENLKLLHKADEEAH